MEVRSSTPWNIALIENEIANASKAFVIEQTTPVSEFFWDIESAPLRIAAKGYIHDLWEVNKEQAGPVLGWTSAIAAYGAFYIPKVFGEQIKATTPENALYGFAIFYGVCIIINWWFYLRKGAEFQNP